MQAVLIAMTILGCDDSVTQCNYIASPDKRWETIAACDAETEKRLHSFTNVHYPTVIAVCERSRLAPADASPAPAPQQPAITAQTNIVEAKPQPSRGIVGFAAKAVAQAREMLPSRHGVKRVLSTPVHFVSDSYSWMARRIAP
ncbi:MAG TPA: hypothetical protein VGC14_01715 [Rhizobium sp.]